MSPTHRSHVRSFTLAAAAAAVLLSGNRALAADSSSNTSHPVDVIFYPILVQAPIFGASVDLPSLPGGGGGGGGEGAEQSGSTDVKLNTLYMTGVEVRAHRWFVDARGQWADLSASRASPRVTLDTKARFATVRGGVMLLGGFSATAGVRRLWGQVGASLTLPLLDETLQGTSDKTFWDPLIGVDWRGRAGAFIFQGNFQGGGFGVGADSDVSGEFAISWRFTRHTDLRLGYGLFYYKITSDPITIGSFQRTLVTSQTLNGPSLGFGIVF
jgi:hypothetical protein